MKDRTLTDHLKHEIKTLASQGRALHKQIIQLRSQPDTGKQREALWTEKRALGTQARCRLLAYAYLRGVPYRAVEANAVEGNIPWVGHIAPHVHPGYNKLPPVGERGEIAKAIKDWISTGKATQAPAETSSTEAA